MSKCKHIKVICINPYELIRKYRCDSCGEVMMCSCEKGLALNYLQHQLSIGTELETRKRVPVTIGFQEKICKACRGLPEYPYPKSERFKQTSKILRYYWREIAIEIIKQFGGWAKNHGYANRLKAKKENPGIYAQMRKEIIEEVKELHKQVPKYEYKEKTQSEVLEEHNIEVVKLEGTYVKWPGRKAAILDKGLVYSAEEFAAIYYRRQGYKFLFAESRPIHVIFGIYMWLLIQDHRDPRVRTVGFGDRNAFDERREIKPIWTQLPEDFGASGYAIRRANQIENHFTLVFANNNKGDLLHLFDYWLNPSEELRQYLWAHQENDIDTARKIVALLSPDDIHRILRYLITDYWRRYVGWPDLIIYNQNEYFFAEVKSSKDKIRVDQRNWICGNSNEMHLPFKLIKIHKKVG